MDTFRKARRLIEITRVAELEPLSSGDERYQEMSAGRSSHDLVRMKKLLDGYRGGPPFAKVTFTGHRGCGKSTELLRLEHELRDTFTCVHLAMEDDLLQDCDYTDLFLWLTHALIDQLKGLEAPALAKRAEEVAKWYEEVTREDVETRHSEVSIEGSMEAGGKFGLFGVALKPLARLKSAMIGSTDHRRRIRHTLQRYASDLVTRLNRLLEETCKTLADKKRPADLLVVIDNLDRLSPQVGETLFFKNGNLLKALDAHVIYTAPIALVLAPNNITSVFSSAFSLPMVKVRSSSGKVFRRGVDDLVHLVEKRVEVDRLFDSPKVVRQLAKMSGGSVRDLMQLLQHAQVEARIAERESIDMASVGKAVGLLRIQYERLLVPSQVYYPLLARVHLTHRDYLADAAEADPERIRNFREYFSELLFNATIFEYNGGESWYDVHPIVQGIRAFREAVKDVRAELTAT